MRIRYLIGIFILLSAVFIVGCGDDGVVDSLNTTDESNMSAKELILKQRSEAGQTKLAKEPGAKLTAADYIQQGYAEDDEENEGDSGETTSESNETATAEEEEETPLTYSSETTIVLANLAGVPANLNIKNGTTVTWLSNHPNFVYRIRVREDLGGKYDAPLNERTDLLVNQTYNYTFNKNGTYQWYSETSYPKASGIIVVT